MTSRNKVSVGQKPRSSTHSGKGRFWRTASTFAGGTLIVAGCSFSSYAGISFAPGAAPRHLQQLASRAQGGDPRAHYQLGLLYEGGQGFVRNLACSAKLYELAGGGPNGLPEARARLESIRPLVEQEQNQLPPGRWC